MTNMSTLLTGVLVAIAVVMLVKTVMGGTGADAAAAREKIRQGAVVIDVRTPSEYASGHYPGATNIPLHDLRNRLADAGDRKKAIVVYCASGRRSAEAAKILAKAGFTDVTNAGGLGNLER